METQVVEEFCSGRYCVLGTALRGNKVHPQSHGSSRGSVQAQLLETHLTHHSARHALLSSCHPRSRGLGLSAAGGVRDRP